MKRIEFEKKDGTQGVKFVLEAGDVVTSRYNQPRENKLGKFVNYSLGVEEEFQYVKLTKGQFEKLSCTEDLTGKKVEAYEYENDYGKQVGVKVL